MLAGKQFRFYKDTMAIVTVGGERVTETIPGGAVVKVIGNPRHAEGQIDVLWDGRVLTMFAVDLEGHGTEIDENQPDPPDGPGGRYKEPG